MESLNIKERPNKKSGFSKKERRMGKIPGILYGKNAANFMFEIGEIELNNQIKKTGEHGVIDINVDGDNCKALIKEIQREPVNHKILHIDLEKLNGSDLVHTEIPVHFTGEGAVKSKGGVLQKEKSSVKVQCRADNIPKSINVDLSNLNIGDLVRIADVEMGMDLTFIEPSSSVIVSVTENSFFKEDGDNFETGDDEE